MTKTLINLQLEVVTLTGEGGERSKCATQENHETHVSLFNLSYSLKEDIPPRNQNSCRFHEPYPFGMPNRGRPGGPYYPINNRKFTYTPSTAIALGGVLQELECRVFLWVLRMAGQSEAII